MTTNPDRSPNPERGPAGTHGGGSGSGTPKPKTPTNAKVVGAPVMLAQAASYIAAANAAKAAKGANAVAAPSADDADGADGSSTPPAAAPQPEADPTSPAAAAAAPPKPSASAAAAAAASTAASTAAKTKGPSSASPPSPSEPRAKNIVVVGGGIVGVCTAYFLAISPHRPQGSTITLVEGTGVASAASGNAGGFLARDWHGPATASLSAMSFDLHRKLAEQFGGAKNWGYRTVDTLSVTIDGTSPPDPDARSPVPWLPRGSIAASSSLGTHKTTAQVHPRLLVRFLAERFLREPGTSLVLGTARALALDDNRRPTSLMVALKEGGERIIDADAVALTAGPWLGRLAQELLPSSSARGLAVDGQMAHTLLIRTKEPTTPHCLFVDLTLADGAVSEPEVYPRPDGTTVICGASSDAPLPPTAEDVAAIPDSVAKLKHQAAAISPVLGAASGAVVESTTACFLPIPDRGRPIIGKVPGVEGVFVGGGLSCWGITQGPGTGLVLAELILEGKVVTADISKVAP